VLRFRYANRLAAAARRPDWSSIAASAGYFDQAHLIRDSANSRAARRRPLPRVRRLSSSTT